MLMHNLLEYSNSYSVNDSANEIDHNNNKKINNNITTSKFFEYMAKIIGSTSNNNNVLDIEVVTPLKYPSNFYLKYQEHLEQLVIHLSRNWQQQQLEQHFK